MSRVENRKFVIAIPKDGKLPNIFALFLYATIIVDFIRKAIAVGWLPSLSVTSIRNVIYVFCFLAVLIDSAYQKKIRIMLLFLGTSFLLICGSYLLNPLIAEMIPEVALLSVSRFFPAFYLFFYTDGWEERIKKVCKWRVIIYLYFFLAFINYKVLSRGYMEIAYNLLCPTLITLYYSILNNKRVPVIGMGIVCLFIIGFGSRGAIICVLLSLICFLLFVYSLMTTKSRVNIILIISILVIMVGLSYTSLFDFISNKLPVSRTIQYLLEGKFFTDESASIRVNIISKCWNEIISHPFSIRGLLTDRLILGEFYSAINYRGYYAHNIIVEILYQFGLIIGSALVIYLVISFARSFYKVIMIGDRCIQIVYSACVASLIPFMMVSGSYLTEAAHWYAIGFSIILSRYKVGNL